MSSLGTTWRPSSFQLRFALLHSKKSACGGFGFLLFRNHGKLRHYQIICCVNTNTTTKNDGFGGWSAADEDEDKSPKVGGDSTTASFAPKLGGPLSGIVAGLLMIAGLTFAAASFLANKKATHQMEPLTTHHQTSQDDVTHLPLTTTQLSDVHYDDPNITHVQQSLQNQTSQDAQPNSDSSIPGIGPDSGVAPSFADTDASLPQTEDDIFSKDSVSAPESLHLLNGTETSDSVTDTSMINTNTETLTPVQQQMASAVQEAEHSSDNVPVSSQLVSTIEPQMFHQAEGMLSLTNVNKETLDLPIEKIDSSFETHNYKKDASTGSDVISPLQNLSITEEGNYGRDDANASGLSLGSTTLVNNFTSAGVPAPTLVFAALQAHPGKVLVPAVVDTVQGQALAALQVLKVIESNVQPGDLCTRREYARWLVSASSSLSRNTISKVYPAMYIENITELAFDDITPEDPDFSSIQGLAEAGLISSKLSKHDLQSSLEDEHTPIYFTPESPLSRQDLVSWKMALERRQLPVVNRKSMEQLSGFIDIDKIHPDAWPALAADLALGEPSIVALAFGYTRLFQPDKPVTNAQAAVAIATGEASDIVNEELARIEAETMAEKAVSAQSELVAQVEKEINASFEKDLMLEREKIVAVEKLSEETRQELERLKSQREEENFAIMKERAAVDSEMEVFSRLRREVEEQLQTLMSNKVEISYEKELLIKLREDAESENREIARLQYELEVERKALSMARAWAEDEAKRAREQAKALEEARGRWESQGIKVIVEDDLQEEATAGVTWLNAGKEFSVEGSVERAESLVDRLKRMASVVRGRSKDTINMIMQKILSVISVLKELALKGGKRAEEVKDVALSKMRHSLEEVQQTSAQLTSPAREGIKRVVIDCKDGVGKLTQKFKT